MTGRHFPDDAEIDEWLASYAYAGSDVSPALDQLKAAASESVSRFRANGPRLVATGLASLYVEVPDPDRSKIRGAIRQLMAALSADIIPLCRHTRQIRPQVLICDPPIIVCTGCLPSRRNVIEALGHRWDDQCDRCGVRVQLLTPVSIGGLAHITITGHVCSRCADDDQRQTGVLLTSRTGNRRARRRGGAS